jgi:hypothetical protein
MYLTFYPARQALMVQLLQFLVSLPLGHRIAVLLIRCPESELPARSLNAYGIIVFLKLVVF